MRMNPYISFDGRLDEAFALYAKILGGEVTLRMTYEGSPGEDAVPADFKSKVMHATFQFGEHTLMGTDQPPGRYDKPQGAHISLQTDNPEEAERLFAGLSEGGEVVFPLAETFWAKRFGMFSDRFGVGWMINCE